VARQDRILLCTGKQLIGCTITLPQALNALITAGEDPNLDDG
jgi:hypothetical protein